MSSEEENRKTLQDKLDSRKFEVTDAKWEKALELIEANEKKKKRRFFLYFIFGAGVLGLGVLLLLIQPNKSEVLAVKNTDIENNYAQKPTDQDSATHNNKPDTSIKKETNENARSVQNNISPDLITKDQTEMKSTSQKNAQQSRAVDQNTKVTDKKDLQLSQNKRIKKESENDNKNEKIKLKDEDQNKNITQTKSEVTINAKNEIIKDTLTSSKIVIAEALSIKDSVSREVVKDEVKESKKDSAITALENITKVETKKDSSKKSEPKFEIHVMGGMAFTPGYQNSFSLKEAVNPIAGLCIRRRISKSAGIGLGIMYTTYGNVTDKSKIFRNTYQDFGYRYETTEIKQSRLHYLKAPLTLDIQKNKNTFMIGVQFMYLVTSASNVQTYNESYGIKTDNRSNKVYGYTNGFSKYDISLIVGYRRRITENISIIVTFDIGLMDIKNNNYFNSSAFERNKSINLGLMYRLFKK